MKPITMYEANDGSRWDEPDDAVARDELMERCRQIERVALHPRPGHIGFSNGGGYLQQPTGARYFLLARLKELGANRDSDGPIGKLLYRMHCIDGQDREWGQPYFALNPDKGDPIELEAS